MKVLKLDSEFRERGFYLLSGDSFLREGSRHVVKLVFSCFDSPRTML